MANKKIGCVPVMNDGRLVGLVTTTDILRYVEGLGWLCSKREIDSDLFRRPVFLYATFTAAFFPWP